MSISAQVKNIQSLTSEVEAVANENTRVLEADQQFQNELSQYLRDEDARIRELVVQFMNEVHVIRQESAKVTNEYRQNLHELRNTWRKTFIFTPPESVAPIQVETTETL